MVARHQDVWHRGVLPLLGAGVVRAIQQPVERWVKPDEFVALAKLAQEIGFAGVMSGPLVRSSYRAGKLYAQAKESKQAIATHD